MHIQFLFSVPMSEDGMSPLSVQELEEAWDSLKVVHSRYLALHEVKLPDKRSQKWVWLAVLFHHKDRPVHKDYVSEATRRVFPNAAYDQQVRHLKRDGWNLLPGKPGEHRLDPYSVAPDFSTEKARRHSRGPSSDFKTLKERTGNLCLTCGAAEKQPHPRYPGSQDVVIHQGHMDPAQSAHGIGNVIPQCQYCNQAYRDDFVFDDKGRVQAIASLAPLKRANTDVRAAALEFLLSEHGIESQRPLSDWLSALRKCLSESSQGRLV